MGDDPEEESYQAFCVLVPWSWVMLVHVVKGHLEELAPVGVLALCMVVALVAETVVE